MTGYGDLAAVVQQIAADPAVRGLGDLQLKRVLPSRRAGGAGLLLQDPGGSMLYVVDVQSGPADDRQIVRLVERWAAVRNRHAGRRCYAVLVAEIIEPRYRSILAVIAKAVPLVAVEVRVSENDQVKCTRLRLG